MQLVIDSKFRPFSYDELIKPMMQYKEAYDKVEADYSNLAAQAEQWKDVANQQQNPKAYAIYSNYAKDLDDMADRLSNGLLAGDRAKFTNLKRRYTSEIGAIAKADEEVKRADELRLKMGPDAIFQSNDYRLDDALHGKKINNKYQSRDALTKRTAAMTEAAMASAMKDPEFQKAMGDQYWILTQHTGGSYEDLKAAIANNAQAQNRFAEIKAQVMKDAGYDRYDASGKQAIEDAINTGLYAGLDKPARSFQANQNFQSDYQKAQLKLAQNADARAEKQLSLSAAGAGLKYNESTKQWERDPTLMSIPYSSDPNNPNTEVSEADLERAGWSPEKDSTGNRTGRMITRDNKGRLKIIEKTANGWITSREQNPDKWVANNNNNQLASSKNTAKANSQNLTPFHFKAWSAGSQTGYEVMGSTDSGFSEVESEQKSTFIKDGKEKNFSISPEGGIHGQARVDIRNYILSFAGLQNIPMQISEGRINNVADKFFKIYRDTDLLSKNHFKVGFIDSKNNEFVHQTDKDGNTLPQYRQTSDFLNRYNELRKELLSEPSSVN